MKEIPVRHITTTTEEPVIAGRCKIRAVEDLVGAHGLVHALHRHDFFFLLAIQHGNGTHAIDFSDYPIQDNCVFFLRPGQVHQLELKAGSTGFLVEFDTAFYHPTGNPTIQRLMKAGTKNYWAFDDNGFQKLRSLLVNMSGEYQEKKEGYREIIVACLDIFFIELNRQSQHQESNLKNAGSYARERIDDFMLLLQDHISTKKQVSQYAELLHLSTYQLNAITKAALAKSASELINEHILLEAKRYLLATANQVKEIADHLGYEDISYFIRFFRKHTTFTPEAFRKKFT